MAGGGGRRRLDRSTPPRVRDAEPVRDGDPGYMSRKIESLERINSIRETNGHFYSFNSCKRLVSIRLHELHVSKFPFVSRIEFIRSKLSIFSAHVSEVGVWPPQAARARSRRDFHARDDVT